MKTEFFTIDGIPAALWGGPAQRVILAVHGSQSNKTDTPIALLAELAAPRGYQVLSFDLPEHGDRRGEGTPCLARPCVRDLRTALRHARANWERVGLLAVSLGAYYSLLAFGDEPLDRCRFLSPVVDMERLLAELLAAAGATPERLEAEGVLRPPAGPVLYWEEWRYIRAHPVTDWRADTDILCGGGDEVCSHETVEAFARRFSCRLETLEGGEHYFHTSAQLAACRQWLAGTL